MRILFALLLLVVARLAVADVALEKPWARATPPNSKVGVVYVTMRSTVADEIISLSSPAADRVEVHTTVNEGGTMKMRPTTSLALPPNETVAFQSGGTHIMLIGLRAPLVAGEHIELTVQLRAAGRQTIRVPVLAPTDE